MAKKAAASQTRKHRHGTPNLIIQTEERAMLADVDKALLASGNSQVVGANGEIPLRSFFRRYLPNAIQVATGHFLTPSGRLSPQIDIMFIDSRYPLLSQSSDGTVLAMLHSVISCFECKTKVASSDVRSIWKNASAIQRLASEVVAFGGDGWGAIATYGFAYRSAVSLETLSRRYFAAGTPHEGHIDLHLLRISSERQERGALLHFEPVASKKKSCNKEDFYPILEELFTPLSDLYYKSIQDAYYTLDARGFSLGDIGGHINSYMSWSVVLPSNPRGI